MSLFGKLFGKKKKYHHKPKCNEPEPCCEPECSTSGCDACEPREYEPCECEPVKHDYCDCEQHEREDE